ncbi:MAG: PAS domain S-box protein, partial [Syntrophobacteraceae bacterium]|nr:PAS domain S-box protein [Syntrophobacteraceae bacterium]
MDELHSMPSQWERELARLREENESLRARLEDSQETLRAIQDGAVDALVIDTPEGPRVFTLQGGEHPYRALIEQMREGAATLTPEGVIHYCNQRCAEMFKLPLERVVGGRMEDFVAPADRAALASILREGAGRTELALRAHDATEVPALVSAISLRAEGPAAVCLVITDLTERKRHEAEIHQLNEELEKRVVQRTAQLAAAKDLYAVTLASIGDGVIVTDAQGRVTFLNREAEHLTGWTSGEAEGHPLPAVFQIINEQTRQPVENPVEKVFRLGIVVGLADHTILIAKDGREIPIDHSGALIRQSDGTVQGVVLVLRDFTEQKQAEEA